MTTFKDTADGRDLYADPAISAAGSLQSDEAERLEVQVVESLSGIAALRTDYAALQAATGNALPFALYEWHVAWCRHFRRQGPVTTDRPRFFVVRTPAGMCVGIIPMIVTQRRLGALKYVSMSLLGADPAITEIRAPLVRPGYETRAATALHLTLQSTADWHLIHWSAANDTFSAALGQLRGLEWQPVAPGYVLDLPPTWEEFRAGLKRNIRESLRHCYNSLKRDGFAFEFEAVTAAGAVSAALERLFALHALRADLKGTTSHPNRFAGAGLRSFMHEVCGELAARGHVHLFELKIGGDVVASRIGFVVGDGLYLYYSGFDPKWSKYSVMTTTVAEAIKYGIGRGLKTVHLSPGNDVSKTRWSPREVAHQTAYEHGRNVGARLVRHAYVKARSGEGLQGWLLHRLLPGRRNWK